MHGGGILVDLPILHTPREALDCRQRRSFPVSMRSSGLLVRSIGDAGDDSI